MRNIVDEYERLGLDDLEDIELLKEMGLTTAAYPEYDEDIIEAVMNMLDVPLEKALKIWDNDNTRFDYYEYIGYKMDEDAYVALAVHRIVDLEEISANEDLKDYTEEANNLRYLYKKDHDKLRNHMLEQGWMVYEFVAIGWDLEELNKFMETI